jgi:hypothetical protein
MRSEPVPRGPARLTRAARLLFGAGLALLGPRPATAEIVERVLAAVDGRPVLLSEVKAMEAIRGLPREAATDALIDEILMFREASRLPSAAAAGEGDEAFRAALAQHPGVLDRASEADLRRLVVRQAVILKYVELRFRPQVRVGDEVVREAYDTEYGGRSDAPDYAEVADEIRERLVRRDLDARIEGWVKELRSGAEVRYNP